MRDLAELSDLRRGDSKAWRRVHMCVEQAAGSFRSTLGNSWEDAVQEAEIRLLRALRDGSFEEGSNLRSFTWRITRNVCVDQTRRLRVRRAGPLEETVGPSASRLSSPIVSVERVEQRQHIRQLLGVMPEPCRELLLMLEQGKSYSDLAWQLGISPGALRVRVHRCRQRARVRLARMTTPLVATAQRLFMKRGYAETSMELIAEKTGITLTSALQTFPRKRAILWEVIYRMVTGDQGISPDESDFAGPIRSAGDPKKRIHVATQVTARMYERGLAEIHPLVVEAARSDRSVRPLAQKILAAQAGVGLQIGEAILDGVVSHRKSIEAFSTAATAIVSPANFLPRTQEEGWTSEEFWGWAREKVERLFLEEGGGQQA